MRPLGLLLSGLALACSSALPGAPSRATQPSGARPTPSSLAPASVRIGSPARAVSGTLLPLPPASGYRHPVVAAERTRAVVLLYHAFDRGVDPLSVSSRNFERQIAALQGELDIIPLSHLLEYLQGERLLPEKVAVITLDDGMSTVYTKAWPIMRRHRAPFTLGLPTALMDRGKGPIMSWNSVREMVASGLCEIASHGHEHRALTRVDDDLAWQELVHSRELIEERTGQRPLMYFYPLGKVDSRAEDRVARAGYQAAFTASGAPISSGHTRRMKVPRTTIFHSNSVDQVKWFFGPGAERLPMPVGDKLFGL